MYKPSFEEEEEGARGNQSWFGRTKGFWFGHPSLVPISPVLQLVWSSTLCNMLGERSSSELVVGAFGRSPPHLFLYLLLFKGKAKVETRGTLPGLTTGESNFY